MSGLFVIQLEAFSLKEIKLVFLKLKGAATIYALLASLTAADYNLWDKYSVAHVHPFVYFYAYSGIVGISYALFIAVKYPFSDIKTEFLTRKYSLLQVACFNTFSYLMILFSLQTGKASYVITLRQSSIALGVFLGWKFLGEAFWLPKKIGIGLLFAGCVLILLAQ